MVERAHCAALVAHRFVVCAHRLLCEAGSADYDRALSLAPDNADLHLRYGTALARSNPKLAREQFEQVNLADDAAAIAVIGAWHAAGDHAEAGRWLNRASKIKKPGAALLAELGADLIEDNPHIANNYFAQALEQLVPGDADNPRRLTMMPVAAAESGE